MTDFGWFMAAIANTAVAVYVIVWARQVRESAEVKDLRRMAAAIRANPGCTLLRANTYADLARAEADLLRMSTGCSVELLDAGHRWRAYRMTWPVVIR